MAIRPTSVFFTIMLSAMTALPPLCIDMNLPSLPEMEAAFGLSPGQGALTLSLFLYGFAIAPVLGGPLADRFGRRRTLLAALTMVSLSAFGCALAPDFRILLGWRLIQGAAAGTFVLMPLAIVRDTLEGNKARQQLSRIMAIVGAAPILAPIIGTGILAVAGWRAIYVVQGLFGVSLLLFTGLGYGETLPHELRSPFNVRQILRNYRTILTNRRFLTFALSFAFCFGCLFSYISGSPGLFIGELGLSNRSFSLIFATTSGGLLLGSLTSGRLNRREISPRLIVTRCLTIMIPAIVGAFALALTGHIHTYTILPLLVVFAVCFGTMGPNALSEAVEPHAAMAGSASGAINTLRMLVGASSSVLVTFLNALVNPGQAMTIVMAGSILLAGTAFFVAGRCRAKAGPG